MSLRFRPQEIQLVSLPVTASNRRNAERQPITNLGQCTPSLLFDRMALGCQGNVCVLGGSSRGIGIAKAMLRRSRKPLLFLGTAADDRAFSALRPEWTLDAPAQHLPDGNGALYLSRPGTAYVEICAYLEEWAQEHFLILHVGNGLQIGFELLNLISTVGQCLILCDSLPQSLRSSEARTITPLEFMRQITFLLAFSAGAAAEDLCSLLPTYHYERVSNALNLSAHGGLGRRRLGLSVSQSRTQEDRKRVFERDDLNRVFSDGTLIAYRSGTDDLFLADLT